MFRKVYNLCIFLQKSGQVDELIELLQSKIKHMEENILVNGNPIKIARSKGKKIQITMLQDYSQLSGNLAWAYLQQDCYQVAKETYRWVCNILFLKLALE
ncbi:hypothetical protein HanRHA438_Chr16g0759811 [Helianthus annuus]|uniref:Uncharacterized protein n=1 Tax=Helianthus annuus TaxID=4232 RepID=A0A9K3DRD0_HELAN|nr:hypothetical protein HanXRQr2_Chr16g0748051 [Helianthus annuus]KAJ0438108.1 hypothetical protein HanHA300_Chr16g0610151 [Helianthus annuus]KAJ0442756.1 hypothetical protein HanIR_Chr16g0812981 [Helianthus annuus]KAJ0460432.1 hypothetical protein HanHA89_Chr16g0660741 [Helianthus annuus]KAJ0640874.1 hypothetical protein HanLR1_Chr16g0620671 [Helianthus annuus]